MRCMMHAVQPPVVHHSRAVCVCVCVCVCVLCVCVCVWAIDVCEMLDKEQKVVEDLEARSDFVQELSSAAQQVGEGEREGEREGEGEKSECLG